MRPLFIEFYTKRIESYNRRKNQILKFDLPFSNTIMKIKKNIAISESGFIFNPTSGDSFSTNPIGFEIINLLREEKSKDEIRTEILNRYQIDESTFEKDYYDFTQLLISSQIGEE